MRKMEVVEPLREDVARRFLDRGGKWQRIQLVLLLFTFIASAQTTFIIIFTGFQPNFVCQDWGQKWATNDTDDTNNATALTFDNVCDVGLHVSNVTSNSSTACKNSFHYDVSRQESIVSEWDLVCDKAYLSEVSQLLFTVGSCLGAAIVAPLSDRFGRRWLFITDRILIIVTSYAAIFVSGIVGFTAFRFLSGVFYTGSSIVRATYLTELSSLRLRPLMTTVAGVSWGLGMCLQALIGHFLRGMNWRYIHALTSAFHLTVILEIIFVKESLLWLYANGKDKEASKILRRAMTINRVTEESLMGREENKPLQGKAIIPPEKEEASLSLSGEDVIQSEDKRNHKPLTVIDMMKTPSTRKLLFIICIVWFATSLVYYGLSLMTSAMSGDRILNFFLTGVVEIPSLCALYVVLQYFGRRTTMASCYGLCAVSLLMAGVFNATLDDTTRVILMQVVTFIGKFGITACFMLLYFYTAELLPTNFRTSGIGMGSCCSKIGSFLSPFASVLLRVLPWGPGIICGTLCFVAAFLFIFLPETSRRQLPQTVVEIEKWENEDKKGTVKRSKDNKARDSVE